MKRVMLNAILWPLLAQLSFAQPSLAQVVVTDSFGRDITDGAVRLADWQGHLMNPMTTLTLAAPATGVDFPLTVNIHASGCSRLMLDKPSTLSATGARKAVTFADSSSRVDVRLAIAPDRSGGFGETEIYQLTFTYGDSSNSIPINVVDYDDDFEPTLQLHFDYSYDTVNGIFRNQGIRNASEMAIKDWFYFFDYTTFDTVAAGDELTRLPGNDWKNHEEAVNHKPYQGFWVFNRGIDSPYSTGFPTSNKKHPRINQVEVPGKLPRSSALILHLNPGATPDTSMADEDWYLTSHDNPERKGDIYGLVMHEFGHSIVFGSALPGFANYAKNFESAERVIDYQGGPVPVDQTAHVTGGSSSWDRLSGHSAGYDGVFSACRWMLTKQTLLIAQEVGWKLRKIGPLIRPQITTRKLPDAEVGAPYLQMLKTNLGGVPIYDWTIVGGSLPDGFQLNRFTGEISGQSDSGRGSYTFTVQLKDDDELSDPVTQDLTITVSANSD